MPVYRKAAGPRKCIALEIGRSRSLFSAKVESRHEACHPPPSCDMREFSNCRCPSCPKLHPESLLHCESNHLRREDLHV